MKTLLIALLSISLLAVLALTGCVYNFHSSVGVGAVRDESMILKILRESMLPVISAIKSFSPWTIQ